MQSQSQKTFPILYGVSKTDKIKQWQISVKLNPDKTATIETQNGYIDGKMNVSHRTITTGKNIGKKNETISFTSRIPSSSFLGILAEVLTDEKLVQGGLAIIP